jgi:hypothetical protein
MAIRSIAFAVDMDRARFFGHDDSLQIEAASDSAQTVPAGQGDVGPQVLETGQNTLLPKNVCSQAHRLMCGNVHGHSVINEIWMS